MDAEVTATRQTETKSGPPAPDSTTTRPILTVLTGFEAGRVVAMPSDMVIGRASDCQLVLSDPGVSRAHVRIVQRQNEVRVLDLGSKNGTFVAEQLVGAEGRVVEVNDVIRLGPHVSIRFARMTFLEEKLARDLYDSSMRDPLTRAYNRRYLAQRLAAEAAYVVRHGGHLSVMCFDFDHFKKINDRCGHAVGDAVLRNGAAVVANTLRSEDVLARVGGEEFVVVLRGIGRSSAIACAERVRLAVESAEFSAEGVSTRATISIGVATSDEVALDSSGMVLVKHADQRLYEAKTLGRNRVVGPSVTS
jgi:diguanylate cyclase (GGDEF)-like protein